MTDFSHRQLLQRLPEEIIQDVLDRLPHTDLSAFSLAARWCYEAAVPRIWREVTLQDRSTNHKDVWRRVTTETYFPKPRHYRPNVGQGKDSEDHHDDTPMLRKLLLIATKPHLGSCVHVLTHRCHLPTPTVRKELRNMPFSGLMLSSDPRTTKLVELAVKNMPNVHTLRIILGHPNINDTLVRCFFDRSRTPSIRHLWLENCRISAAWEYTIDHSSPAQPLHLDFSGLQSVRLRRLTLRPTHSQTWPRGNQRVHCRRARWTRLSMRDEFCESYESTVHEVHDEVGWSIVSAGADVMKMPTGEFEYVRNAFTFANKCDDNIYKALAQDMRLPLEVTECELGTSDEERAKQAARRHLVDIDWPFEERLEFLNHFPCRHETPSSAQVALRLLQNCSATLTDLCLDSVLTKPLKADRRADVFKWHNMFEHFFSLRFPHLRSFQARTDFVQDEALPCIYLLDYSELLHDSSDMATRPNSCALEFMEAHPNLQCLAWPADRFFAASHLDPAVAERVDAVIDNLSRTIVDLRVDAKSDKWRLHDPDDTESIDQIHRRARRRRFIAHFAAKMTQVQSIKIEGGVPRDEYREVLRALHQCPLSKIVIAGPDSPVGNTWGAEGEDLQDWIDSFDDFDLDKLEAEDADSVYAFGSQPPLPPAANFTFTPEYGWPPGPPMLHTIASFHASTLKELKLCGAIGAPVIHKPTPITTPLLAGLKYCHELESLTLNMWLPTRDHDNPRWRDVISYWLEVRGAQDNTVSRLREREDYGIDPEDDYWQDQCEEEFAPEVLAGWLTEYLGGRLSESAKARRGGVEVRVRMYLGDGPAVLDFDLRIARDGGEGVDVCLGFTGPRGEFELERRMEKLGSRRWFG